MASTAEAHDQVGEGPRAGRVAPASRRADSAEEIVVRVLGHGEQVQLFVECLRRTHLYMFEKAVVAITDRRLLVVTPAFPWGHELHEAHERAHVWAVNGKERVDGSRLLVMRTGRGTLCLYFGRARREDADEVLTAVGMAPKEGPPPVAEPLLEEGLPEPVSVQIVPENEPEAPASFDAVDMAQEFSGLLDPADDEDDSY